MRLSLLVALLLLAAGCKKAPAHAVWPVERISVSEATLSGNASLDVDAEALRAALGRTLQQTGRFEVLVKKATAREAAQAWRCRLDLSFTRETQSGDPPVTRAEVGVLVELTRRETGRYEAQAVGRKELAPGQSRAEAFRSALDEAMKNAVDLLVLEIGAGEKDDAALIAQLDDKDPRARELAARTLAERRSKAAVPKLIEKLQDSDHEVMMRAVAALRAVGDPRAVEPLIELTKDKDPQTVVALVDVIGARGGAEAEAYLYTLASGHPDERVRYAAAEAQKNLLARKSKAEASAAKASAHDPGRTK